MPREITKYLCEFKCGKKAQSTIENIERHESICWKNPARKACSTCKYEVYEEDGDGYRKWMSRACKVLTEEQFEELHQLSGYNTKPEFHIQPVINCLYWENKALSS